MHSISVGVEKLPLLVVSKSDGQCQIATGVSVLWGVASMSLKW